MEDDRAVDEQTMRLVEGSKMPVIEGHKVYTSETPKLAAALAKARPKFKPLKRTKKATIYSKRTGKEFTYSYATLSDVLECCIDALSAEGLSLSAQTVNGPGGVAINRVTLLHESGESRSSEMILPITTDIRDFGSALTYSTRYQSSLLVMLAPDEDDDGGAQDKTDQRPTEKRKRTEEPQDAPQASQDAPGTISKQQRASFIEAIRSAGLNAEDAREIMRAAAGVEDSKHIPVEKFAQVMQAIIDRVK